MIEVSKYIDAMQKEVFPAALEQLAKCVTETDLSVWRKTVRREIYSRQVIGDLNLNSDPQDLNEASKEQLKMSQRVYLEA